MSGPEVVTLGCRLNLAESAGIARLFGPRDDVVVVNSCAVTAEAVRQSRVALRRARARRPSARLLVTGCAADVAPEAFAGLAEHVPNAAKLDAAAYGVTGTRAAWPGHEGGRHARAFLPVQNGCDHRCTFCIIPYGRGPSRSRPAGDAIGAVRAAVAAGAQEVVLTGVDLTAYGADLPGQPTLGALAQRILAQVPELRRLRLSSLDPCEVDDRLLELIAHEPRLMPHLHLSLQAGDDLILKRMRRRHDRAQAVALVERVRGLRPAIAIGADLIAGFPTEDDAMFARTLALIEDCSIVLPHIFPFSPRAGTPAARMPQLPRALVKERAARLRAAGAAAQARWLAGQVGARRQVLVELDGASGHAENFARVMLDAPAAPNTILPVRVTGVAGDALTGVAA